MVNPLRIYYSSMSSLLGFSLVLLLVSYTSHIGDTRAIDKSILATNQTTNQINSQTTSTSKPETISGNNTASLIMRTDKTVYNPGEIVKFIISNTGAKPVIFPDSALGLTVKNVETNMTYPINSVPSPTTLKPDESKVITWGQTSANNTNAPPGVYVAYLPAEVSPISVTFRITLFTSPH